ncbi:hypothetical protein [Anaerocolumna sp.]|uniref:hypothetical protein n=1 Tax=Anaerocolumna sp. TaxID=2041569 RepID=UPI0028A9ED95|nr:hypothetical protein [Anaerocolumna sp.]
MAQFEYINGSHINKDIIKEFYQTTDRKVVIKYKDGTSEKVPDSYLNFLSGENFIIQVIPCVKTLYAAFGKNGDIVGEDTVYYLGLCADGNVRGLICNENYFEIADTVSNFVGLFETSQYKEEVK